MSRAPASPTPLLVLGVLPSEDVNWSSRVASERRAAARETWLTLAAPKVLTRFALPDHVPPRRRGEVEPDASDVVRLPLPPRSTCMCAELTHAWFSHALQAWPAAKWIGKTEDHVYVQTITLQWELERLPHANPLWLGLFYYASVGDASTPRTGCWGGQFEDDATASPKTQTALQGKESKCDKAGVPLVPSPSHELDLRTVPLARAIASCEYATEWLDRAFPAAAAEAEGKGARRKARCAADCAATQGHFVSRCASRIAGGGRLTLAHETWTKMHSLSPEQPGWRPFALPGNLTMALNMNLADHKNRDRGIEAWRAVHATLAPLRTSVLPPLLYANTAARKPGEPFATPLNPLVASMHHTTCRWGGCHPPRGEPSPEWPGWRASAPCEEGTRTGRAETCGVGS